MNRLIATATTELPMPRELVLLITSFVVWKGPSVNTWVDVWWPPSRRLYLGVVIDEQHEHHKDLLRIRYVGWSNHYDEWCDVNARPAVGLHWDRTGCLFPGGSCGPETSVGPAVFNACFRATPFNLKIGTNVVYKRTRKRVRRYYIGYVVAIDRDCPPRIKLDIGNGHFLRVMFSSVRKLRNSLAV